MGDKVKYCSWCGEECKENPVQVADTPILEHMEEKIDAIGRTQVWGVEIVTGKQYFTLSPI